MPEQTNLGETMSEERTTQILQFVKPANTQGLNETSERSFPFSDFRSRVHTSEVHQIGNNFQMTKTEN